MKDWIFTTCLQTLIWSRRIGTQTWWINLAKLSLKTFFLEKKKILDLYDQDVIQFMLRLSSTWMQMSHCSSVLPSNGGMHQQLLSSFMILGRVMLSARLHVCSTAHT